MGKTRMGVEVGYQLIEAHQDGVFFADLSTIDPGAEIAKTVMAGSGLGYQSMSTSVFALTPLPTSAPGDESPSARLFLERAAKTAPGFQPSERERQLIEEICRRLDGIPLAIKLAAARLQTLTLDEGLHLLSSKGR